MPRSNPRPNLPALLEHLRAALRPDHRWFPLAVFLLAMALGLLIGLAWFGLRHSPAVTATTAPASSLDPQHPPLPAPMAGDQTALPPPIPGMPGAVHIDPPPRAAPSVASASAPDPVVLEQDAGPPVSGDSQPQIVDRTQPVYPIEALRAHEEGVVRLQIAIDAQGNVEDVRVVQSSRSRALDGAAQDAVRNWKFRAAIHDGQPTTGTIDLPVEFRLDEH